MRSRPALLAALTLVLPAALLAQDQRPFDVDDLVRMERVSDPQLSADGKWLVYSQRSTDMTNNRGSSAIWSLRLDQTGAQPRQLVGSGASSPRLSADGKSLYFLSSRTGSSQVQRLSLREPGEAQAVTALSLDVDSFDVVGNGEALLLSLAVFPDCETLSCTADRLGQSPEASGVVYDRIFIRHWDHWKDGRQQQLFSARIGDRSATDADLKWLSKGLDGDVHSQPFGGDTDYDPSPDGQKVVFALRIAGKSEPWSTNFDLYEVPIDGSAAPRNLTADNQAWDGTPVHSPDGRKLAWLAMSRPGFEADRFRIMLRDLASGSIREVAPDWDRSPGDLQFSADGKTLYVSADDLGQTRLFAINVADGKVRRLTDSGSVHGVAVAKDKLVYARDALDTPSDLYQIGPLGGTPRQLTRVNAERLSALRFGEYEQFSFPGWNDETVYGWVVKPADYQAGQRYPVAFIVHGGPQGSMGNSFHYRWNPQTYAGKGYAVVFIDFHGSTGYGQAFTDAISGDWGGKPLVDLQKGLSYAIDNYDFLDGDNACALGASYGGYMMNWVAGAWNDRFKCIVNHDGIFDNRFMSWSTEELWFDEWEHGGPQYEVPENYERHNPVNRLADWQTPMLIIHGAQDFRVPLEQGIAAFTALQRRGIESRFLYFPDENHWVLKPKNSIQWHREVERWLAEHLN
ncbi:MAG: S9 family peptidase [Xanthomonadales bacterium]|nr:S9 family peptidase [Xanthomonadales bacterium]